MRFLLLPSRNLVGTQFAQRQDGPVELSFRHPSALLQQILFLSLTGRVPFPKCASVGKTTFNSCGPLPVSTIGWALRQVGTPRSSGTSTRLLQYTTWGFDACGNRSSYDSSSGISVGCRPCRRSKRPTRSPERAAERR